MLYNIPMKESVDLVILYVDNTDNVWRKAYIDYCIKNRVQGKIADLHTARYEDIGLIHYQLKLVKKYMPFINNIFLVVSNIEQVPKNIDKDIKIILHKDILPYNKLPTFNSATIEMFLHKIPNLSEYFIYANDDMLPCKPLKDTDFFENGKIKITMIKEQLNNVKNLFRYQCINSNMLIDNLLKIKKDYYLRPIHSFTPMIKSHSKELFDTLCDKIMPYLTGFRNIYQPNQYIYPLYEYYKYGTYTSNIDFLYTETKEDFDFNHQIVCINRVLKDKQQQVLKGLNDLLCD